MTSPITRAGLVELAVSIADDLDQLVRRVSLVLGDTFDDIERRFTRGRSSMTPPQREHRLMKLVWEVREMAASFRKTETDLDDAHSSWIFCTTSLAELGNVVALFEEFAAEAGLWPTWRASLKNPDFYDHAISSLYLRQVLRNWGLLPTFVDEAEDEGRSPDIRLDFPRGPVFVENKSPPALADRIQRLTFDEARKIVAASFKSAGTGRDGQLRRGQVSVLAISGILLPGEDISMLLKAGKQWFRQHGQRRSHVAALWCTSVDVYAPSAETVFSTAIQAKCSLYFQHIGNPAHRGPVEFRGLPSLTGPLTYPPGYRRWNQRVEYTAQELLDPSEKSCGVG